MNKQEAKNRLEDILAELDELGREAQRLVADHFPEEIDQALAYGVFTFGSSCNPYDTTLAKLVDDLGSDD